MAQDPIFVPRYQEWALEQLRATEPRNRDGYISPSQVLGCATAAIHQLNGEPREHRHDPDLEDLFRVATWIHEYYQRRGEQIGLLTNCEDFVEIPEWRVRGQIDGIITTTDEAGTSRRSLFEIKTVPEWLFDKLTASGTPLAGNLAQNMLYLKATGLDETRFLYVERSYFRKLELVQRYDPVVMARVERWIQAVLRHAEAGTYPKSDEVWQPEGRCRSCVYFATCSTRTYAGVAGRASERPTPRVVVPRAAPGAAATPRPELT